MKFGSEDKARLRAYRDILFQNAPELSVYLGAMESATSSSKTQVTVANNVRKVMSVWLATDETFTETDYYADPKVENFTGKVITLDSDLPATNTAIKAAYYSDCADCGWDALSKQGRDPNCPTCLGTGMSLALGSAVKIPVERLRPGALAERLGITGEEATGIVFFRAKVEHENMIRAALQLVFEEQELVAMEDETGRMQIRRLYQAGQATLIRVLTQYARTQ